MRQTMLPVLGVDVIAPGTYLLRIHSPWLAQATAPGQFVHLRVGDSSDPLLRRPISVHRVRHEKAEEPRGLEKGEVDLLFQEVGRGTKWLAARKPGDEIDVLGPLGQGFTLRPTSRRLLLVGGGLGVAPLVMLADKALEQGLAVTLLCGARSAEGLYPSHLLPPAVEYYTATEDGSLGHRGLVTELLPDVLDWADQICACGPNPMLAALQRLPRNLTTVPIEASLEQHMGCGVGVCYGCVVETKRGLQRVCHDGPVFDLRDVRFG